MEANETARLAALRSYRILDTEPERSFDDLALLASPGALADPPRRVTEPVVLAIGPEGGFIDREVETFRDIGFTEVSLGPRVLRVETAVAFLVGRLF